MKRFISGVGLPLAVTGILATGCDMGEPAAPRDDMIRNDHAAERVIAESSNKLLGQMGITLADVNPWSTVVDSPRKLAGTDSHWIHADYRVTNGNTGATCDVDFSSRVKGDEGVLGGWLNPSSAVSKPAITEYHLGGAADISFLTKADEEPALVINGTRYTATPEGGERQLTNTAVNEALRLGSNMLTLCAGGSAGPAQ
jgi:hypothetical protein